MALTIEQYLRGKVDYEVTDIAILTILEDRGIDEGTYVAVLSQKQKDLCLADLYMWLASSSVTSSGEYESDGGWQRQKSTKNVFDRGYFKAMAEALYAKYDEAVSSVGKIIIKDLY